MKNKLINDMSNTMGSIMSKINFDPSTVKIIQCVAAHNEEDWVSYPILSTYNEVDRIIIVEGAVRGRPNSTEDGHSTDKTLEVIRSIPDPDDKMELITKDDFWKDLEEQKQVFLDRASKLQNEHPDWSIWLYIADSDEVMHPDDIKRLRKAIEMKPYASEFVPTFLHFWRDFKHVRCPEEKWNILHQRFFKYQSGMVYKTHPMATDASGRDTCLDGGYQSFRFQIPDLYVYHYGNIKSVTFQKEKAEFYKSELKKYGADEESKDKYLEFRDHTENDDDILEFDGEHPVVIRDHPLFQNEDEILKKKIHINWTDNLFYTGVPLPLIFTWYYRRPQEVWPINPLEVKL